MKSVIKERSDTSYKYLENYDYIRVICIGRDKIAEVNTNRIKI